MLAFTRALVQEVEIIQEKRRQRDTQRTQGRMLRWANRLWQAIRERLGR